MSAATTRVDRFCCLPDPTVSTGLCAPAMATRATYSRINIVDNTHTWTLSCSYKQHFPLVLLHAGRHRPTKQIYTKKHSDFHASDGWMDSENTRRGNEHSRRISKQKEKLSQDGSSRSLPHFRPKLQVERDVTILLSCSRYSQSQKADARKQRLDSSR